MAKSEFLDRLLQAGARNISRVSSVSTEIVDGYSFDLPGSHCGGEVQAYVHVKEEKGSTSVNVQYISYHCRTQDDARIQEQFEEQIVKAIARASKQ